MSVKILAAALGLVLPAAIAEAAPAGLAVTGQGLITDAAGMTLYTFDNDAPGESNCYDGCAGSWPPAIAAAGATPDGDYSLVQRRDGALQWAFRGLPLYTWAGDANPGDRTGDGVGGVWHIAVE
ncbi:hypothetical protein HKCCE2091_10865 [Rhodobacterales bacterium HKCCE2091]|nr:hypothetical protein [Rhodobacterales bacterium HKCCE2091]